MTPAPVFSAGGVSGLTARVTSNPSPGIVRGVPAWESACVGAPWQSGRQLDQKLGCTVTAFDGAVAPMLSTR